MRLQSLDRAPDVLRIEIEHEINVGREPRDSLQHDGNAPYYDEADAGIDEAREQIRIERHAGPV